MNRNWLTLLLTGFGSGTVPVAPGTAGSFAAIILATPALLYFHRNPPLIAGILATLCLVSSLICVLSEDHIRSVWDSSDPGAVVLDEFAGVFLLPLLIYDLSMIRWMAPAFVFFRIFDMLKPVPVHYFEGTEDRYGIVLDDLIAAFIAGLLTRVACFLLGG